MLRHRFRFLLGTTVALSALAGAAACVDLFHSTDFELPCTLDGAACVAETGPDVDPPDTGVDAGPIDLCAPTPTIARARAERACAYLGACLGTTEKTTFGECMVRALAAYNCDFNPTLRPHGSTEALWQCLATVNDCSETARCVFGTEAPRCPGSTGPVSFTGCNVDGGAVVVECGDPVTALGVEPCAIGGRTCATVDRSTSFCAGARGASCTGTPRCEGTAAVVCKSAGGIDSDEGLDCAAFGGGRCVRDDAGVACAPDDSTSACTGSSAVVCKEKSIAESCVDGRTVRFDCASIGQGCGATGVATTDPIRACKNLDAGCVPTEDSCDAGILRSCAQGRVFDLTCTTVTGLGGCAQAAGRRAACTID